MHLHIHVVVKLDYIEGGSENCLIERKIILCYAQYTIMLLLRHTEDAISPLLNIYQINALSLDD